MWKETSIKSKNNKKRLMKKSELKKKNPKDFNKKIQELKKACCEYRITVDAKDSKFNKKLTKKQ